MNLACDNLPRHQAVRSCSTTLSQYTTSIPLSGIVSPGSNECLRRESSLLDIERKLNESQTMRAASGAIRRFPSPAESNSHAIASHTSRSVPSLVPVPKDNKSYQTRTPVITGEVHYRGMIPIDGIVTGQLGSGGTLAIKQRTTSSMGSRPELSGEISFRDMLRVNGHIAGTVYSKQGTLIIDDCAVVDANIDVATVIISGTVNGDIVAHHRVELSACAKIYGNIWTRSIAIKDGAVFDGLCTMIGD